MEKYNKKKKNFLIYGNTLNHGYVLVSWTIGVGNFYYTSKAKTYSQLKADNIN